MLVKKCEFILDEEIGCLLGFFRELSRKFLFLIKFKKYFFCSEIFKISEKVEI